MTCGGNQSEICGGPNRLNVYDFNMIFPVTISSSSLSSSAAAITVISSSSVAPNSASAPPTTTISATTISITTTPATTISATPISATTTTIASAGSIPTTLPAGWSAQGCWVDGVKGRILPSYQAPDGGSITPASCAQLCFSKGYNMSGTEYYTECYCDNAIYSGGVMASDQKRCNTPCKADSTQMCGGAGYLSLVGNGTPKVYQPPVPQTGGLNNTWTY